MMVRRFTTEQCRQNAAQVRASMEGLDSPFLRAAAVYWDECAQNPDAMIPFEDVLARCRTS
jgi:hypothetical protein